MRVLQFTNNHEVYSDPSMLFNFGEIHYIEKAYICGKDDLDRIKSNYLAGKRFELVVSSNEFNTTTPWRWTVPISTYHPGKTMLTDSDILFKNRDDITCVLRISQMRSRNITDFYQRNGAYYSYSVTNDFMSIVLSKIHANLPDKVISSYQIAMDAYNDNKTTDISYLMREIETLKARVNVLEQNQAKTTVDSAISKEINKITLMNNKYIHWDDKTKKQYIEDFNIIGLEGVMEKYQLTKETAEKYYSKFGGVRRDSRYEWTTSLKKKFVQDSKQLSIDELMTKYELSKSSIYRYKKQFSEQFGDTKKK